MKWKQTIGPEFRSQQQREVACRILLEMIGLPEAFGSNGPITDESQLRRLAHGRGRLPRGWLTVVHIAAWVWGAANGPRLEALSRIEPSIQEAVGDLISDSARGEIDQWITDYGREAKAA